LRGRRFLLLDENPCGDITLLREIKKESLTRKLTEVAGRMSSSKARCAQVIPLSGTAIRVS
jgi:hypothetical protein